MEFSISLEEKLSRLNKDWSRITPFIITDIAQKKDLLQPFLPTPDTYMVLEQIPTPQFLYDYLKQNKDKSIIIDCDILQKRKNYLDILEGAISSSPDSGRLWPVRYGNKPEFTFKGRIMIFTNLTREEILFNEKYKQFKRDCRII